ncbi:hypothetical protein BGZ95_006112, partial [Linnemannia exigua]
MPKESNTSAPPDSASLPRENNGDNKSVSSQRIRKRDKFLNLFRSSSPETKVKGKPQSSSPKVAAHRLSTTSTNAPVHRLSNVSTHYSIETEHEVTSTAIQNSVSKPNPLTLSSNLRMDIFTHNVDKPAVLASLPGFRTRIGTTPQLALCLGLLLKDSEATEQQSSPSQEVSSNLAAQLAWVKAMRQDPVEQEQIRWLGNCMVEEFAKDALKDSTEIAEMVLL